MVVVTPRGRAVKVEVYAISWAWKWVGEHDNGNHLAVGRTVLYKEELPTQNVNSILSKTLHGPIKIKNGTFLAQSIIFFGFHGFIK